MDGACVDVRTGNVERGVATDGADAGARTRRVAVVRADVRLRVLVVDDAQEEQLAARQQHPVRRRVLVRRRHRNSVAVPRDHRRRVALRLAVERRRLVLGDVLALRVLDDARVARRRRRCACSHAGNTPVTHRRKELGTGSRVISVLDSGAEEPGFKSQQRRCRVTVLGKLLTPVVPLFTKQQNW